MGPVSRVDAVPFDSPCSVRRAELGPPGRQTARRASLLVLLSLAASLCGGCRQDMHDQPKFYPQRGTSFFPDGRSVRPQVPDTVARSQAATPSYLTTGMQGENEGDGMPLPVSSDLLERGQERYNIYCTPCHSRTGYGQGMIVQRGYLPAASFHTERLRQAPLGHFFNVITNGYGAMPDYAAQLTPEDRWAVVAYIRALQLSQNAKASDVAPGVRPSPLPEIAEQEGMGRGFADMSFWRQRPPARPVAAAQPTPTQPLAPDATVTAQPANTPAKPGSSTPAAEGGKPPKSGDSPSTEIVSAAKPKPHAGNNVAGKQVYEDNCSICHQSNLGGKPPKFPALVGVVERTGEDHVRTVINEGVPDARPMMPSFGDRLSATEIADLIAFLKSYKGED